MKIDKTGTITFEFQGKTASVELWVEDGKALLEGIENYLPVKRKDFDTLEDVVRFATTQVVITYSDSYIAMMETLVDGYDRVEDIVAGSPWCLTSLTDVTCEYSKLESDAEKDAITHAPIIAKLLDEEEHGEMEGCLINVVLYKQDNSGLDGVKEVVTKVGKDFQQIYTAYAIEAMELNRYHKLHGLSKVTYFVEWDFAEGYEGETK